MFSPTVPGWLLCPLGAVTIVLASLLVRSHRDSACRKTASSRWPKALLRIRADTITYRAPRWRNGWPTSSDMHLPVNTAPPRLWRRGIRAAGHSAARAGATARHPWRKRSVRRRGAGSLRRHEGDHACGVRQHRADPPRWSHRLADALRGVVLPGYTAFCAAGAGAAHTLLAHGRVRIKPAHALGGSGHRSSPTTSELAAAIAAWTTRTPASTASPWKSTSRRRAR